MKTVHLTFTSELLIDASPVLTFAALVRRSLETIKPGFDPRDLPSELIRPENDRRPVQAGQLAVRLYPSDLFFEFAAALFAWDRDPCLDEAHRLLAAAAQETSHNKPPKKNKRDNPKAK